MSLLDYKTRMDYWEWCRQFIDREAIYRVDSSKAPIPGKAGGVYHWQIYLRRATYHPEFSHKLGLLFWEHFLPVFESQHFQVCACLPSGAPIGMSILYTARTIGISPNVFFARREAKTYGLMNWFEGTVLPETPVLIIDDLAASSNHMLLAAARVQLMLDLPLHRNYFAVINKVGCRADKQSQHTENYLNNELVSLFTLNNLCLTATGFEDKYYHPQEWSGIVR